MPSDKKLHAIFTHNPPFPYKDGALGLAPKTPHPQKHFTDRSLPLSPSCLPALYVCVEGGCFSKNQIRVYVDVTVVFLFIWLLLILDSDFPQWSRPAWLPAWG